MDSRLGLIGLGDEAGGGVDFRQIVENAGEAYPRDFLNGIVGDAFDHDLRAGLHDNFPFAIAQRANRAAGRRGGDEFSAKDWRKLYPVHWTRGAAARAKGRKATIIKFRSEWGSANNVVAAVI